MTAPPTKRAAAEGADSPSPAAAAGDDTALAGGVKGAETLRRLTAVVLDALAEGAVQRGGPLPTGGPDRVVRLVRSALAPVLPTQGTGAEAALRDLVRVMALGAADPSDPHCAAHLHCPPLAMATAADLAASALNPSMDSWDQAPGAGALEAEVTAAIARLVYPHHHDPDALVTSGGTESNLVALLLARERARAAGAPAVQVVCGGNAHHSVERAAWLLGLPAPITVPCRSGRMLPAALESVLADRRATPVLVVATAGTTDEGMIDPLPELARIVDDHGAELHVDAAYGGPLLFSDELAARLHGIDAAVSVTFDLHKLGWQPIAAGMLAVSDAARLRHLGFGADYLNPEDDTAAGLPDVLGRSVRTSRRPDALKIAVTLRALGRRGLGVLVEQCVRAAEEFADAVDAHPRLRRRPGPVGISTVLFRPTAADALPAVDGDRLAAEIRRRLLHDGSAVLGRAMADDGSPGRAVDGTMDGAVGRDGDGDARLWLKATLLHPHLRTEDFHRLLELVDEAASALTGAPTR